MRTPSGNNRGLEFASQSNPPLRKSGSLHLSWLGAWVEASVVAFIYGPSAPAARRALCGLLKGLLADSECAGPSLPPQPEGATPDSIRSWRAIPLPCRSRKVRWIKPLPGRIAAHGVCNIRHFCRAAGIARSARELL